MSGKHNITIEIGSTWAKTVTWKADSVRVDLTGYTAKMHIRDRVNGNILISLSTENGRITLEDTPDSEDETEGVISLVIEADGSNDVTRATGTYDLKLYSSDDPPVETRLLRGSVTFRPAVTIDSEA